MLNSVLPLLPVVGVAGVGIVAPIIYEHFSSKSVATSGKKQLEQVSYLLGSCQKESNTKKYNIQLYLSSIEGEGEKDFDRGLGLTVFVKANEEKILGGWRLRGSANSTAQLEISPQTIDSSLVWNEWNDFNNNCPMENIISLENSTHEIEAYDIGLVCGERNSDTCDIQFAKDNKFAFKENLKPKLKYKDL